GLRTSGSVNLLGTGRDRLPDFVVLADKDTDLPNQLELLGIRVFNSSETIALSDDKIASYQSLALNHLPVPKTVIAPKSFHKTTKNPIDDYQEAINILGFPMIIKEAFGSFGEQVHLV